MSTALWREPCIALVYSGGDGEPTAESTIRCHYITLTEDELETLFADRPGVFVAGDLVCYPVGGAPDTRTAPDVLVAFSRPRGHWSSRLRWLEGGVSPQGVFEIRSPSHTVADLRAMQRFYGRFGVQERWLYLPASASAARTPPGVPSPSRGPNCLSRDGRRW